MSYSSNGPKPFERASKSSHHHIINDPAVVATLKGLHVPPAQSDGDLKKLISEFVPVESAIKHVVAIDGGYTEVPIRNSYPYAAVHFFQFGALHFRVSDLQALEMSKHIAPEDMQRLKNIERLKLVLTTRGTRRQDCTSIKESIRRGLYEFLAAEKLGEEVSLIDTLAWFVFRRYKKESERTESERSWSIGSHPYDIAGGFNFAEANMSPAFSFECQKTKETIFLSDVFRLHELIEEEAGGAGIAGYVSGLIEHLVLLHVVRNLIQKNSTALSEVLFILDRPTGWFGVTATLHKLMFEITGWLFSNHNIFLVGLEKSGAFVEHAARIQDVMPNGSFLVLNDKYIYKFISPGAEDLNRPYAATSYYGHKVIFKTLNGQMYVVSAPVKELKKNPSASDIPNLAALLTHIEQLHCDMFENALLPVALANKLVSLSAHPSSQILKSFAVSTVG